MAQEEQAEPKHVLMLPAFSCTLSIPTRPRGRQQRLFLIVSMINNESITLSCIMTVLCGHTQQGGPLWELTPHWLVYPRPRGLGTTQEDWLLLPDPFSFPTVWSYTN